MHRDQVIDAIENKHYVDDFVASFTSEEKAFKISAEEKRVHQMSHFELRGFVSNSVLVQQSLNSGVESNGNIQEAVKLDTESYDKILGMHWNSQKDVFVFDLKLNRVDKQIVEGLQCPTKRQLLSMVKSVYDPFGMLADLIIYGKVLVQDVWRTGIHWNDLLPKNIFAAFKQWVHQFKKVKEFKLRRCYSQNFLMSDYVKLHVFVDASEQAFAAVAYWRITCGARVQLMFICGKTRCAPLKLLTIPRLELQAAVLGARLRKTVLERHDVNVKSSTLWTDSRTVVSCIKSDHRQYKPFVAHRVSEILESTQENDWYWVPTKLNAADKATKTSNRCEYDVNSVWISGPEFLLLEKEKWPSQEFRFNQEDMSERRKQIMFFGKVQWISPERFSNYSRLKRTVGWIWRFVSKCRKDQHGEYDGELTAHELNLAESTLCKIPQLEAYWKEIEELLESGIVSKESPTMSSRPN